MNINHRLAEYICKSHIPVKGLVSIIKNSQIPTLKQMTKTQLENGKKIYKEIFYLIRYTDAK